MNEALRPSTLGEILDRTANLYRSRFLVFFGIAAVPSAVMLGFGGAVVLLFAWAGTAGAEVAPAVILGTLVLSLIGLPLMVGTYALSGAALCHAASTLMMGGAITISSAFKAVWRRGWHYIGLFLLQMLIIVGAPFAVWTAVVMVLAVAAVAMRTSAAAALFPGALMLLVILGLVVYVVWMLLRLCLAFPAAVAEQTGAGTALKRASALSRGTRWRILVLFLLGLALGWVASLVLMVPVMMVMALVPALNSAQHAQLAGTVALIATFGASFVVQGLTKPVYAIALVLFYYDQRVRLEGFDIELLMREAGMLLEPGAKPEVSPWMPVVARAAATENVLAVGEMVEGPDAAAAVALAETASEDASGTATREAAPDAMGDGL